MSMILVNRKHFSIELIAGLTLGVGVSHGSMAIFLGCFLIEIKN